MLKSELFACSYIVNLNLEAVWWRWLKRSGSWRQLCQGQGRVPMLGAAGGEHVTSAAASCAHTSLLDIWEDPAFPCHCFSFALRDGRVPALVETAQDDVKI